MNTKLTPLLSTAVLVCFLLAVTPVFAFNQKKGAISEEKLVAMVNDEPITLDEFNRRLVSLHAGLAEEKTSVRKSPLELLNRMINIKLILQEARSMGLDELDEVEELVDKYSQKTLRDILFNKHVKNIKADEEEVKKIYREAVKEYRINSILLGREDDAVKIEKEIKAGNDFDRIAKKLVDEGMAEGGEEGIYFKMKALSPEIAKAAEKVEVGSVSPVIKVKNGFVILKLEDIRFPEDPEAMKEARKQALRLKKAKALADYKKTLSDKYVQIDKDVLDSLYHDVSGEEFQELLNDNRIIAEIKGEKPLTVGELTGALKDKLYHGVGTAIESKKLRDKMHSILDEILIKRTMRKEALSLSIDKTELYINMIKEYENSVIFGTFLQKVIVPDIKLKTEDLKKYYNENITEYTSPVMVRINSLVFHRLDDAENTVDKLRKGTDFKWLNTRADGQVSKDAEGLLIFGNDLITMDNLPEGVQKAVSGARPEDIRLFESPEGYFYVLYLKDVIPSEPLPFDRVKKPIAKFFFNDRLKSITEDWANKLREVSEIKIYHEKLKL